MPKRHDDLFRRIANFGAIRAAARRCAVWGKRKKPGASAFFANLERELLRLERELQDGTYRPGSYVEIKVRDPKERIVSAAPFRDRVVHHALCTVIGPLFERGFIGNTFANRVGKGTHRAVAAYEAYRERHAHVLRCDLYRYFPSIDHAILKAEFRRRIACAGTLALMDAIVDGSNAQEPVDLHFPGDDLFEPHRRRRGLPIGNLTSQFFANLYLDGFDHFVTEVLRAPYVRYVDDFALFDDDPAVLADWRARIERYLAGPNRTRVPGGSSSGAAVAVADRMCEIAIGSDTGGSTRAPAALCGIVGYKPSKQWVPTEGAFPLSYTLDSIGPLAHTVADCSAADAVTAGEEFRRLEPALLAGLRLGMCLNRSCVISTIRLRRAFPRLQARHRLGKRGPRAGQDRPGLCCRDQSCERPCGRRSARR
jgi:RNA-directed DNA polymerase